MENISAIVDRGLAGDIGEYDVGLAALVHGELGREIADEAKFDLLQGGSVAPPVGRRGQINVTGFGVKCDLERTNANGVLFPGRVGLSLIGLEYPQHPYG